MKKILAILLSAVMLLSLWGCGKEEDEKKKAEPTEQTVEKTDPTQPEETQPHEPGGNGPSKPEEEKTSTPILYKVTDEAGNTVYLLGSIHVGIAQMYPLPDYVLDAYQQSDALAVECDIIAAKKDMDGAMELLSMMVLTDGTKITDYISRECYERAVEIMEENQMYVSVFDMYKPILWENLISNFLTEKAGTDANLGVDMYFLTDAYETGKTIYEVESMEIQYTMLAGLSMELQVYMLEDTVNGYDDPQYLEMLTGMCKAWAEGDEETLLAAIDDTDTEGLSAEEIALIEEYNEALEGQRNVNMTQYAMDALESGETVFIVVGAAHVLGDDGMAAALEEAGYTVTRVE